jgi:hypothetical protein
MEASFNSYTLYKEEEKIHCIISLSVVYFVTMCLMVVVRPNMLRID